MIHGIGVDIVKTSRIKKLILKFGNKFYSRVFSYNEIQNQPKLDHQIYNYFAVRFAAKEAFVKASGSGFVGQIKLNEIEISKNTQGKPYISLSKKHSFHKNKIELSLSHEDDYAIAFVVITALS